MTAAPALPEISFVESSAIASTSKYTAPAIAPMAIAKPINPLISSVDSFVVFVMVSVVRLPTVFVSFVLSEILPSTPINTPTTMAIIAIPAVMPQRISTMPSIVLSLSLSRAGAASPIALIIIAKAPPIARITAATPNILGIAAVICITANWALFEKSPV